MALETARALAANERDDSLHVARILLLLFAQDTKRGKPVEGLTKLAKLDFLLRYPNCLEQALVAEQKNPEQAEVSPYERTTIESKMIRFRYGPWDHGYRRWVAIMISRGLASIHVKGKTINVQITSEGRDVAAALRMESCFLKLDKRSNVIVKNFQIQGSECTFRKRLSALRAAWERVL